ncbi:MAG: ParB/RepB/Spo0J family partition protein, partial [Bacteroidales bacterium]
RGVEIARIPFRVEGRTYTEIERICDMIIRNDGKNFTPYEHAKVFDKLSDKYGWTVAEISKKFGKSHNFVRECLSYLTLPEEVQESIKSGEISAGAAKTVVNKIEDKAKAVEVIKEAVEVAKSKGKKTATEKDVQAKEVQFVNATLHAKNALRAMMVEMTDNSLDEGDQVFFDRISDMYSLLMDGKTLLESIVESKPE